jgi:hypothetical protein
VTEQKAYECTRNPRITSDLMGDAFAVLVGIQKYQQPRLSGVDYAHNDAHAIAAVLFERFEVPKANIKIWLDHDATVARLETELKSDVRNLAREDRFYFFYAGHGLWAPKGGNRLTAWDSHLGDLQHTTISLEDVLLKPLRQSRCSQSAIFIDACATEIHEDDSRDLLADMKPDEFAKFVKNTQYSAVFFACSPEEKSYSSPKLKGGVWSHHLARALRGEEPAAIYNERFITGESLQNYLLAAVRKYTREEFVRKAAVQTPYARINQNGTFILVELPEPAANDGKPLLVPDFSDAYFSGEETRRFKSFEAFTWKKGHSVPTEYSASAAAWARRLLSDDVAQELQEVAVQARKILKVRSKDIAKQEDTGSGSVATDVFRFEIEADQNREDPSETVLRREIRLRVPHTKLPADFDDIFPGTVDTFFVPVPGTKGRYTELLDAIEVREEDTGASSEGDQTKGTIDVRLEDGTQLLIDTEREIMMVKVLGASGCLSVIEGLSDSAVASIAGTPPKLIGKKP